MKPYERPEVVQAIRELSSYLDVPESWVIEIIQKESGWNPQAKNPNSSARGLIQFMDATARDAGYNDSLDLVNTHSSIVDQLNYPVKQYFSRYKPFKTNAEFYLSVFYPALRKSGYSSRFSDSIIKSNPRVITPAHYVAYVKGRLTEFEQGKVSVGDLVEKNNGFGQVPSVVGSAVSETLHDVELDRKSVKVKTAVVIGVLTSSVLITHFWNK